MERTPKQKISLYSFIIAIGLGIVGIIQSIFSDGEEGFMFMLIGGLYLVGFFIYMIMDINRMNETAAKKQKENYNKQHPHLYAEKFYEDCKKAKISLAEDSPKATIARAKLVAEQNHHAIPEEKLIETYLLGKKEAQRVKEEEAQKATYDLIKVQNKYLPYHGRDKVITLYTEKVDYYRELYNALAMGKTLPYEKQKDWALMGGIASGIAGGAAGLAVASDIQRQNAEARAYNDQLRAAYAKTILPTLTKVGEDLNHWEKKLKKANRALVDDTNADYFFSLIKLSKKKVEVLSDGSFIVTASATIPDTTIYDTVKASIDGTLTAIVSQNGNIIEEVPMILPVDRPKDVIISGVSSIGQANKDEPCTVEFKYHDLWAIEK